MDITMTANRNLKRRVRERAARTGESYTSALRHVRPATAGDAVRTAPGLRLAVAQSTVREDPRSREQLRQSGAEVRDLMREAAAAGARIVHFPEGATCSPHKRLLSVDGPDRVGPADWDRMVWDVLGEELAATAALAGQLGLWTVLGSPHRLSAEHRPHNSLYVISDTGTVATRYDERYLSHTKVSHLYTPGTEPVTFTVAGLRLGLALGLESHFPEVFRQYEDLDVDCVLFSTTGGVPSDGPRFATEAQAHAAVNGYWVSFAVPAQHSPTAPAGVIAPGGRWLARCPSDGASSLAVVDLDDSPEDVRVAVTKARPWRRAARAGLYEPHHVHDDPRSDDRAAF